MAEPFELTALEARSMIDSKRLSPVELVQSCITRIDQFNPAVNAIVTTDFDNAIKAARAAETELLKRGTRSPLHGIPVAIKDMQDTAGLRTTYGSPLFRDHVPSTDEHCVAGVRQAGAIIVGKTNIPEFSIGGNTVNRLFGATGNPYDTRLTCGGSSGGSAAALAAEMTPLATGSDTGGSLRLPAAFCGVVAHRPSAGVVPHPQRSMAQTYYGTQGPMARTVRDAALLLTGMAVRSTRDPMAYPLDVRRFGQLDEVDIRGLRVGVTVDLGGVPVSNVIRRTFEGKARSMEPFFGSFDWVDLRLGEEAMDVFWKLRSIVFIAQYSHVIDKFDAEFNPNILSNYEAALRMDLKEVALAHRTQMDLYQRVQAAFERYDVLLCPAVSVSPFPWKSLFPQDIDGLPSHTYVGWVGMTSALTVVGNPITTLPCGLDELGMPFGIQVIGQNFEDHATLSIAAGIEDAFMHSDDLRRRRPDFAQLTAPLRSLE